MCAEIVLLYSAYFFCEGRCEQGGGGSQGGEAERLSVADNGRVRPWKAAAQTGRPDGEGPTLAGGGHIARTFFILPTL